MSDRDWINERIVGHLIEVNTELEEAEVEYLALVEHKKRLEVQARCKHNNIEGNGGFMYANYICTDCDYKWTDD